MKTNYRSFISLGMPAGIAIAILLALFFSLPGVGAAPPPTTLSAGDIAILGFNFDNPDEFAFVLLVDVTGGTEIHFTDNGWLAGGGFRSGEGEDIWTTPTDISAGTVITMAASNMAFSGSGDQIIAFQGTLASPTVIYALNSEGSGWQSDATSSNTSALPTGLVDGYTAIALNEIDNAKYDTANGTSGTKDSLLYLISDTANWSGDNTTRQNLTFPPFSVTSGTVASLTLSKTGDTPVAPGDSLVYTVTVASQGMTVTNVTVTDTLPLSVTFDSASIGYTNPATGVYVFSLGQIVSGTQSTFNLTVTVDAAIIPPTVLTNTVEVSTTEGYTGTAQFVTNVYPLVSIYDIQTVSDPATDDASPYAGQTVLVEGIVTAPPGELGSRALVIEDAAGGAWSGLYVYDSSSFPGVSLARGDEVRVLGNVTEYNGITELMFYSVEVLSTGNPIPDPEIVNTGDFVSAATAEQWEAVYIEFQNATVTNPSLGYGEWAFDDGSGETRADDLGSFTYSPALGDYYNFIRGIGWYSYGNYKLEPRDDNDIFLGTPANDLGVLKSGPAYALVGDTITYTIQVRNPLLVPVENVILTDTLPVSVTNVVSASNALTATNLGDQIVWEFGTLNAGVTETVYLTVSTPMAAPNGFVLTNDAAITTTSTDDPTNNTASVNTTLYSLLSVYDIQYVSNPAADDASPYEGQTVLVEGVVTAKPGEIDNPSRAMVIADPSGGAWSGVVVFDSGGLPAGINAGDYVQVLGNVSEYYGLTEIVVSSGFVQVITPTYGAVPPAALTTGDFPEQDPAASEQWEGVLVEFQTATVTDDNLGYGEWAFDDGSGAARADDLGGRDGNLTYDPLNGDVYNYIRGIGWYSYGRYKLEPRSDGDISIHYDAPLISKLAPSNVASGATYAYTLTVENYLGYDLTSLVITDTVPASLSGITPQDGGVYANGTVTWTVASLPDQGSVDVHFTATAPVTVGTVIVNDAYAFIATNWVTPTFGAPFYTVVGDYTPIYLIQGDGMRSTIEGQIVTTQGVVIGLFEGNSSAAGNFNGFFIQDASGDGDADTSDAIFVNQGTTSLAVNIGDLVEVTGEVQEFSEWDGASCYGDACLTQVAVDPADISVTGSGTIAATTLSPLGDPVSGTLYYESLEGMLVTFPSTTTVVGPTNYGTIRVVPGSLGIDRVFRNSPYEGMPLGVRPYQRYGNGAASLIVGSVVSAVDGPLTFTYGDYVIAEQDGYTVDFDAPPPVDVPSWDAVTPLQFSAATINTYNFDTGDPALKATKLISQVIQMNGPTFLALQEIDAAGVLPGLTADLAAAGYNYDYAFSHADVGGHGVALLWRTDQVSSVITSTAYQDCSPYGSSSSTYDPMWATCQAQGEYPLFSRRPVVLTGTINLSTGPQQVVVIANHFKSKLGGDSADARRLEQGQFVHDLAANFETATPYVLMMGDLNDFEDAPPLQALYAGDVFTNTWYTLPADQRYSYIYLGVSQILDHILVSPALLDALTGVAPLHFNADFPYIPYYGDPVIWRNSDHDPVVATFEFLYRSMLPLILKNGN